MNAHDRILLVDDHEDNIEILEDTLGDNYPLAVAKSGEEALTQAERFRPALILLDIMMPGIDGYETCRQLRMMPQLRHTKIVMVSAKAMARERLKGYEAGADDYIAKPFDLDELRAKVRVYLRLNTLEELHQLKSDVITLLSHETATPLNGILGALELVLETPEMASDERIEVLTMAHASAVRLQTLSAKCLALGALRSGHRRLDLETVEVGALVEGALEAVRPQADLKALELVVSCPAAMLARLDDRLIGDVLIALLDNAIRVSPAAGRIDVRVWRDDARLFISVLDQGPGIDPALLPDLFEPFVQGNLHHHTMGHGLSLAIAHAALKAHDGTLDVESTSGQGARFTCQLPVRVETSP